MRREALLLLIGASCCLVEAFVTEQRSSPRPFGRGAVGRHSANSIQRIGIAMALSDHPQQISSDDDVGSGDSCNARSNSETENHHQQQQPQAQRQQTPFQLSRRHAVALGALTTSNAVFSSLSTPIAAAATTTASSSSTYQPGIRATAYRVDSTVPPTLLSLKAREETKILAQLGQGTGTNKEAVVIDTLNLNNMLNKAVFGTINAVTGDGKTKTEKSSASFVCLGIPKQTMNQDVNLAVDVMTSLLKSRPKSRKTALGLYFCPYSLQTTLDEFTQGRRTEADLVQALSSAGVDDDAILEVYAPIWQYAKQNNLDLLALSPEYDDLRVVRSQGLQNINPERRTNYVVDPNGFIALTQDPKFNLYADRSLLKEFNATTEAKSSGGNFFSERILVHEAAATAVARYAVANLDSLVVLIAPTPDVRFLMGINGRIPRICSFLDSNNGNSITNNAVTTILLNPTAADTLSKSRYLRLEIGTAPDTLQYQSKIADYLWFSSMPKVNLLPRLMN